MFEFTELVSLLLQKFKPAFLVSHSFGSVTALLASSRNPTIPIEQWLIITTPHDFKDRIMGVKKLLKVSNRTVNKLIKMTEADANMSLEQLNIKHFAKKIPHIKKVVIVHSQSDGVIPVQSARIAHQFIAQSTLIELKHAGHYAILWSKELKKIVTDIF